jgi:hypothetical protein
MTDLINSHVTALGMTGNVRAPDCIPAGELLGFEQRLAKTYRAQRRQWTPEYRARMKAARDAQEIKMAPMTAMMQDFLKGK